MFGGTRHKNGDVLTDKVDGLEPLISPADGNAQILSDAINTTVI